MTPRPRILVLGGTAEARLLCDALAADAQFDVIVSFKGLTETPLVHAARVVTGGFGGEPGLCRFLRDHSIAALVDASHPFAATMATNAAAAARRTGIPHLRLRRPPWRPDSGVRWLGVASIAQAVERVAAGERVFLALGARGATAFAARRDVWFLIRTVDPVAAAGRWSNAGYIVGLPDQDETAEAATLKEHRITTVVARNSGGLAGYAKIAAAQRLGLGVMMIAPPPHAGGERVATVAAARAWLRGRFG